MTPSPQQDTVLAVHPTRRGFGWVLLGPGGMPLDWGIASAKAKRNARSFVRFERLLARYEPSHLVLEKFEGPVSRRATRIQHLCQWMIQLAAWKGANATVYSRAAIRLVFASVGAQTRDEIALAVAERYDELKPRLPRRRDKVWYGEHPRMALFSAAAVGITHIAMTNSGQSAPL